MDVAVERECLVAAVEVETLAVAGKVVLVVDRVVVAVGAQGEKARAEPSP